MQGLSPPFCVLRDYSALKGWTYQHRLKSIISVYVTANCMLSSLDGSAFVTGKHYTLRANVANAALVNLDSILVTASHICHIGRDHDGERKLDYNISQ